MAFWFACYPPGQGLPRRQIPAARAYEVLRELLLELMEAKDTLTIVQPVAPDDERGRHHGDDSGRAGGVGDIPLGGSSADELRRVAPSPHAGSHAVHWRVK